MAQIFFPEKGKSVKIPASAPHPANAEYVIAVGTEMWNGVPHHVMKIQMAYDGKIEGRKNPSFPYGSDDFSRVCAEVEKLFREEK